MYGNFVGRSVKSCLTFYLVVSFTFLKSGMLYGSEIACDDGSDLRCNSVEILWSNFFSRLINFNLLRLHSDRKGLNHHSVSSILWSQLLSSGMG